VRPPRRRDFGLGGALGALVDAGTAVDALCFTRGEASTLGEPDDLAALGDMQATELDDAARVHGLRDHDLLAYPDGRLTDIPLAELAAHVATASWSHGSRRCCADGAKHPQGVLPTTSRRTAG
jgi:LmbE family N-acetylglucosaminyl deacetylase